MGGEAVEFFKKTKFERVQELRNWGLNTPDYVLFERGDYSFLEWDPCTELVSLRYYLPPGEEDSKFGTQPHSPRVSWPQARELMLEFIDNYSIMINPGSINPKDTIHCGNLQMDLRSHDGFGTAILEIVTGPYTVRDVYRLGRTLFCNLHGVVRDEDGTFLAEPTRAKFLALKCPYWNQGIFEWSAYPYPIGWKKESIIFWEIRHK